MYLKAVMHQLFHFRRVGKNNNSYSIRYSFSLILKLKDYVY